MKGRFEMSMMGEMTFFLGLQVNQSLCGIFINQSKYALEILKKYRMESCDPVGTPIEIKDKLDLDLNGTPVNATKYRSMIGALMYLTSSRPDIIHATCLCARYQAKLTEKHLKEVKRIFRYLWGTFNMSLWYMKDSGFELTGFSDADYAGCKDTFKSTSGGAQFLGEKLISWSSKKQDCMALSTAKAEYVSLSACCAQVLWMRTQLTDYGLYFNKIPIYCDSKSAIAIFYNPVQHSRTKHIAVRYHFIKKHVETGTIELYFVKTDYQLADLFTKALPAEHFNYLVRRLGMRSLSPQELDRLAKYHQSRRDLPRNTPLDRVEVLAKDEDPSARSDGGLKKRNTNKDAEPAKEFEVADSDMPQDQEEIPGNNDEEPKEKVSKTFDELMSTPIDFSAFIMNGLNINNLTQETLLGPAFRLLKGTRSNYAELEYDFEECYKALSEKLDWENLEGNDYPFDLTKPLPLVMSGNRQKRIEDMVLNIWVPVKVVYDKHALWEISHWREQRKTLYGKHGYGYLREITVRRADNNLYRFKEGDFPRLRINDIEDMLLLMKKINVTKPETIKSEIRQRDPYTPYQDPQGFIYVNENGRNTLMHSNELYKFSDGTLTRLQTSLDDITKNIRIEYLPKRRWSTLERKRANIMIKVIDKQLKESRMIRSLEKFIGGRDYETDLWLLQRTI
uniref:Copia protein n=1 Tax=Tanacetum cinerariifolium TaxID=118510 RepID=A0A699H2X0_TANCI|nr:copia protein [Tanacetum cinerariifolium]